MSLKYEFKSSIFKCMYVEEYLLEISIKLSTQNTLGTKTYNINNPNPWKQGHQWELDSIWVRYPSTYGSNQTIQSTGKGHDPVDTIPISHKLYTVIK